MATWISSYLWPTPPSDHAPASGPSPARSNDMYTTLPSTSSRRSSLLVKPSPPLPSIPEPTPPQPQHRSSAPATLQVPTLSSLLPGPSPASPPPGQPSLIRRQTFTSLLLPVDPLSVPVRHATPAPSTLLHGRSSTALHDQPSAPTYPILQLTPTLGLTGPQAPQLLHELYRVRNSLARERRRNRSLLAGVVQLMLMGLTMWMAVMDGIAIFGIWGEVADRGGAWGVGDQMNVIRETAVKVDFGIRLAVFVGGWGVLAWLRTARRPHRISYLALFLAYLLAFLQLSLSITNLVYTLLFSSPSVTAPTGLRTRCTSWSVDVLWYTSCASAPPTTFVLRPWILAASVRLLIFLLILPIHLFLLHRFHASLSVTTIIDPTRAPTAEIRAMLARHDAEIVQLEPDPEAEKQGQSGERGLPSMPERRREWYASEDEEHASLVGEGGKGSSGRRSRIPSGQTPGEGGVLGTLWGAVGWIFGSGNSLDQHANVDVEKADRKDMVQTYGNIGRSTQPQQQYGRLRGDSTSSVGRVYAPADLDNPDRAPLPERHPPPQSPYQHYEQTAHMQMPVPRSIPAPAPATSNVSLAPPISGLPRSSSPGYYDRYEFDDVEQARLGRARDESTMSYRDLFKDVGRTSPRREREQEHVPVPVPGRTNLSAVPARRQSWLSGSVYGDDQEEWDEHQHGHGRPTLPPKDSPPLPPPPPPPHDLGEPYDAQGRRYAYDFISRDSHDDSGAGPSQPLPHSSSGRQDYDSARYWSARRYSSDLPLRPGDQDPADDSYDLEDDSDERLREGLMSPSDSFRSEPGQEYGHGHERDRGDGVGGGGRASEIVYVQMSNGQLVRKLSTIASEGEREWDRDREASVGGSSLAPPGGWRRGMGASETSFRQHHGDGSRGI